MHRCQQCGKILHEIPYECHRCGHSFCSNHHLPENHNCSHKPYHYHKNRIGSIIPRKRDENWKKINFNLKTIKQYFTLRNFTGFSVLLIFISIALAQLFPQFPSFFLIEIGIVCFLLAYFWYAVKCWGSRNQISAILLLTIPLFLYFFSTTKIVDLSNNAIIGIVIQFCIYAIISIILLFVSEKIKTGIYRYILKKKNHSGWYFLPNSNYVFFGIVFLSIIVVMGGSVGIFTSNVTSITNSISANIQNTQTVSQATSTTNRLDQIVAPVIPSIISGNQFTSLEESKKSIDYINSLRARNGIGAIRFDSRVYNIGMARVNDMDKYGYMDHTNPQTGSCADSIKTQFGLSNSEYVAENAFGFSTGGHYAAGLENEAVDSWMTSRGHRYNLLYPHSAGAVACSSEGHCVFLGLNTDRFGEGCHTGAQGMAFWNGAAKQPGEI
jgi:uncharacterized protein YkwD